MYRAVKPLEQMWKKDEHGNRIPSSAVFKDSKGVSVDRQNYRDNQDAVNFIQWNFKDSSIISVTVNDCEEVEANYLSDPTEANPYHCIIRGSDTMELRKAQAKKLSKKAVLETQ